MKVYIVVVQENRGEEVTQEQIEKALKSGLDLYDSTVEVKEI